VGSCVFLLVRRISSEGNSNIFATIPLVSVAPGSVLLPGVTRGR
jgi:hypothetical protein